MKKFIKIKGRLGIFKVLAESEGYLMVRGKGFYPFVITKNEVKSDCMAMNYYSAKHTLIQKRKNGKKEDSPQME